MATRSLHSRHKFWQVLYLLLLALLLYAVLPQLHTFRASFGILKHAGAGWLAAATAVSLLALIAAAAKYRLLGLKKLRYGPTLLVQLASLLTNRLLPVGIGGMGINYLYLRKARHSASQAGVVIAMNNLLGFIGHMLLLVALLVWADNAGSTPFSDHELVLWTGVGLTILVVGLAAVLLVPGLRHALKTVRQSVKAYSHRPRVLAGATFYAILIALSYAICLWWCAKALGTPLSFLSALVVLTAGVAASSVTPTPGGLIGVEASLVAGLVAYKISAADALAIALLYRLITYWFSLLLGAVAFLFCRKARYI